MSLTPQNAKPLSGITIIEIESLGPAPFCGHVLVGLGAKVIRVTRPNPALKLTSGIALVDQGKEQIDLDLKSEVGRNSLKTLVQNADALIEGMRPGVMERLGIGPGDLHPINSALVYGRVTGWGQDGPLAHAAGHDINYAALSGALWYSGQPGQPPLAPPTLIGDVAGGALYLAIGVLSAILSARQSGQGQVVDAAMVDGSAHMMNLFLSLLPTGLLNEARGQSLLDGAYWYNSYECADGEYVSIGSMEPQFYAALLTALSLSDDKDFAAPLNMNKWSGLREKFSKIFKTKTQAQWCEIMEGTDICFAPVLSPMKAANHPHMRARNIYSAKGGQLQAAPAPRFAPLRPANDSSHE